MLNRSLALESRRGPRGLHVFLPYHAGSDRAGRHPRLRTGCGRRNNVTHAWSSPRQRAGSRHAGFTLVEIIFALAVLAVAVLIAVTAFLGSASLFRLNGQTQVAAALAEEQLDALIHHPTAFTWPSLSGAERGARLEIVPTGVEPVEGGYIITPPTTQAVGPSAVRTQRNYYDAFSWTAFASPPTTGEGYIEVTVVVRWMTDGREHLFALTSPVPLSSLAPAKGAA